MGAALSNVSPGMAVGDNIYPSLQRSSPNGLCVGAGAGAPEGEAFCLAPSGIALAGHSPAILLYTFAARQWDPASFCQQLLGM